MHVSNLKRRKVVPIERDAWKPHRLFIVVFDFQPDWLSISSQIGWIPLLYRGRSNSASVSSGLSTAAVTRTLSSYCVCARSRNGTSSTVRGLNDAHPKSVSTQKVIKLNHMACKRYFTIYPSVLLGLLPASFYKVDLTVNAL